MDKYYLIGNPVTHSLSPMMHNYFAKKNKQNMKFNVILANKKNVNGILCSLIKNSKVKGLSITTPFKQYCFKYCNYYDYTSKICKSISNIIFDNNRKIYGFNFDGIACLKDIKDNLNYNINNKNLLIIGAGATSHSVCYNILSKFQAKSLTIFNRNYEKSLTLISNLNCFAKNTDFFAEKIVPCANIYDLIINTTSCSFNDIKLNEFNFKLYSQAILYETIYSNNSLYVDNNFNIRNGVGMLFELNKIIFSLWRGIKINIKPKDYFF